MVATGFGIGFVPELGLQFPSAKSVAVRRPGGVALSRCIYAVTRRQLAAYPAIRALLAELQSNS